MNLIVDVGNTRAKLAVFKSNTIVTIVTSDKNKIVSEVKKIISKYVIKSGIIASVTNLLEEELQKLHQLLNLFILTAETKTPFSNLYKTPKTLGVDRIALATAAVNKYPNKNVLVIDAGTCITFDCINNKGEYLGGAISLGIEMRYKALHSFTSKLPLLEKSEINDFIGKDTATSIHSGVINGVTKEIDGVIAQYKKKFKDLTVVLTGGDTNFLAKQLKNGIFASPNFILEGLNTILTYNTAND